MKMHVMVDCWLVMDKFPLLIVDYGQKKLWISKLLMNHAWLHYCHAHANPSFPPFCHPPLSSSSHPRLSPRLGLGNHPTSCAEATVGPHDASASGSWMSRLVWRCLDQNTSWFTNILWIVSSSIIIYHHYCFRLVVFFCMKDSLYFWLLSRFEPSFYIDSKNKW